jgi:hypothetical protein
MRWEAFAGALLAIAPSVALAQQIDPRLAGPAVQLLQGQVAFVEARIKATQEDAEAMRKRLCEAITEDKRAAVPECAAKAAEAK